MQAGHHSTTNASSALASAISRRGLLQVGSLGLTGLSLAQLLQSQQASAANEATAPAADSCIIIFLNGGPSHLDMWDMKPNQPAGIRGEFQPIHSAIPGYQVCEHLPRMSRLVDKTTIVRSMHHSVNNSHAAAVYVSMTGHDRGELGGGAKPDDNPTPGAVLSKLRPPTKTIVPQVHLPYITKEGAQGPPQPGFFAGYLGQAHDPLFVLRDPNADDFKVPELSLSEGISNQRLAARRALFANLDRTSGGARRARAVDSMDGLQQKALDLLSSEASHRALRLSEESPKTRESYGRNRYGQSTLLARRLIEAGTRMVTLSWAPDANATWDTHSNNFQKLKTTLLPQFDAACASLLDDLQQRGMLDRTLVAVLGDFGRTPKVNANNGGRDHWNYCYSLMLFGGGFQQGLIHGSSNKTGAFPERDPMVPADIIATLYHLLGIRHDQFLYDRLDRPHLLVPAGRVAADLIS